MKKKNSKSKHKTQKVVKKNSNAVIKVLVLIVLGSATTFFITGCSYHPDCDQTKNGRGNIPASCRGATYAGVTYEVGSHE